VTRPPCATPGRNRWHAWVADWNAEELGSIPAGGVSPRAVGSAKLGTPCERMHLAKAKSCACCRGLIEPAPDVEKVLPAGCRERQAWLAAWNCGELISRLPGVDPPVEPGSGKLGTPCERIQRAYASGLRSPETGGAAARELVVVLEDR
jgi:hypothetical protein